MWMGAIFIGQGKGFELGLHEVALLPCKFSFSAARKYDGGHSFKRLMSVALNF